MQRPSTTAVATSLPGVAALLLGLLYTLGALLTMADLSGAGLATQDTLPLIPITDLLARGVGVAVAAAAVLAGFSLLAVCNVRFDAESDSKMKLLWWGGAIFLIFGSLALAIYVAPVVVGLGLIAATPMWFLGKGKLSKGRFKLSSRQQAAAAFIIVVVGFAVNAVVAPRPFPTARIRVTGGYVEAGSLVTSANGRWALAQGKHEIDVIPDAEAVSVLIQSRRARGLHRDLPRFMGVAWWVFAIGLFLLLILVVLRVPPLATN